MSARALPQRRRRAKVLRRSAHLSLFRRGEEYYVYHDLWGYLLAMDRQVLAFLLAFTPEGSRVEEVLAAFGDRLRPEQLEGYVATFRSHRCLLQPGERERADAFERGYPVKAPWIVAWRHEERDADGERRSLEIVLAYRDRRLGRVVLERLTGLEAAAFDRFDGERTSAEIADQLEKEHIGFEPRTPLERLVRRLTHSRRQVLKLSDRPIYEYLAFPPPYLRSSMPFERIEAASLDVPPPAATEREVVDLASYHRRAIEDASTQFDVEETTLSHMFREPHPALGGRSYGEAFAEALLRRNLVPGRGEVLEIGGGVGFFALRLLSAIRERMPRRYGRLGYTILDLSPVLQDSQRLLVSALDGKVRQLQANASVSLPVRDHALALVISNEVIADLETVRLSRTAVEAGSPPPGSPEALGRAHALLRRHRIPIDDAPERFWFNLGALQLVEELWRVLAPGGAAVLTEFGDWESYPIESTHLGHSEFSIHFGHLMHVARSLGFDAEGTDIVALLEMDTELEVLSTTRSHFVCLQALLQRRGVNLQKIAYTREQLEALTEGRIALSDIEGLRFAPVGERTLGLRPREFKVAILRKPERA